MRFFSIFAIAFALIGTIVIASGDATASAIGCDNRQVQANPDPHAISVDIKAPYGYLCHSVHTNGKKIKEQRAAFTTHAGINEPLVGDICNWRIDFVYYNKNGDEYMRDKGETISDCKEGASRAIAEAKTLQDYGSTCARLIIDGELRFSQCYTLNE